MIDLCVSCADDVLLLSRYIYFFQLFGKREKDLLTLFKACPVEWVGDDLCTDSKLNSLLDFFNVSREAFEDGAKIVRSKIELFYDNVILKYDSRRIYKDYWSERDLYQPV